MLLFLSENSTDKMKILRYIPVVFSFLLLAAHFSRIDISFLTIVSLLLPFLLFIKRKIIARIIQTVLILGAGEWIRAMFNYIEIRKETGEDWMRLAVILSCVSIFTLLSAIIFQTKAMKKIYKQK